MTQTIEQPAQQTEPSQEQIDAETVRQEVKAEAEALDVGQLAATPEQRAVFQYLRRRAQLDAEITHIKEQTSALIHQLEQKMTSLDYVYTPLAMDVAKSMLTGKSRSVKTPFGKMGWRELPARVDIINEEELIKAAETQIELMGCIKKITQVSRSGVAEHYKSTGEIPPGCELLSKKDRFYVG